MSTSYNVTDNEVLLVSSIVHDSTTDSWIRPPDAVVENDGTVRVGAQHRRIDEFIEVEPTPEGHCVHGVYVGGCGIDWLCGSCELGDGHNSHTDASLASANKRATSKVVDAVVLGLNAWAILGSDISWSFGKHVVEHQYSDAINKLAHLKRTRARQAILAQDGLDDAWEERAQVVADEAYAAWERHQPADEGVPAHYSEIDEVHEYGYVPD
jgi:hypothetical protein